MEFNNDIIIEMSNLAKKDNSKDKIDATKGMLFLENKKLAKSKVFTHVLKKEINNSREYINREEEDKFKNSVIKYLGIEEIKDKVNVSYSCGGTGALSFAFKKYCSNKTLFLPHIRWSNYDLICKENNVGIIEYLLYDERLNVTDLIKQINNTKEKEINILINDPCHNPTGLSLSYEEWDKIFRELIKLNAYKKINLIIDIAYLDFTEKPKYLIKYLLSNKLDGLNILLCCSFSKSLSIYGMRFGSIIHISNNIKNKEEFKIKIKEYNRSTFSSSSTLLVKSFNRIMSNDRLIRKLTKEINNYRNELIFRKNIFIDEMKKYKITNFIVGGFFAFFHVNDSLLISEALKKEHVYVVPLKDGIRISIASINKKELKILSNNLAKCINFQKNRLN